MTFKRKLCLGMNLGIDPSVAIVENGKVIAFSEEERHIRIKHAPNIYPKEAFRKKTKVPILLNTSFNLKGEPIVYLAKDALRTFWSSALDVLVLNEFIITKPKLKL